jgi:glyoxylase-like metal-dependent hydrolase (beta-lactamase superfamily II)
MKRCAPFGLVSLVVVSCAGSSSAVRPTGGDSALERAVVASGGADKLAAATAISIKGSVKHWEPEQSVKPGGEMRLAGESTFVQHRAFAEGITRTEWVRKMAYPAPREYKFTELVTPVAGLVEGVDSTAVPKSATATDPPRHAMSGVRLAAALREIARTSPRIVFDMKSDPSKISAGGELVISGQGVPALRYQTGGATLLVAFDPATGLPSRIRSQDADTIYGDSNYDLVLSDWRDVGGIKVAHTQSYELNGREVIHIQLDEVQLNPTIAPAALEIPADLLADAPRPATGDVPYQWVIRRQFIGTYLDTDAITYDPKASEGLRLVDIATGVSQVSGGSHNSLVVEMADHVVVFDAPIGEVQSRFTIGAIHSRYPAKPIKYLVLAHHHMDHIGGARSFVAEGAIVLVPGGTGAHIAKMFAAPHKIDGDALERSPRKAEVVEVDDKRVLTDGKRTIEILRFDNPHVDGMLLSYIPDARLGFVVDVWSPGRDKLGDKITPAQAAVVAAVKRLSSVPERLAGGHGSFADYAPLAALAGAPAR